jgi:hypothetical protein
MSIWLRYLAVVTLVGNALNVVSYAILLGRATIGELSWSDVGRVAFNLVLCVAAIALAALIASPSRQGVRLSTKIIAALCIVSGVFGIVSSAAQGLVAGQQESSPFTSGLEVAVHNFAIERIVQNAFFSACTLALAILVIASRRSG